MSIAQSPAVLIDGLAGATIPVVDRGFLYGDGLFETMAVRAAAVPLWPYHVHRLRRSARFLALDLPSDTTLLDEILAVADGDCVVRLVVTRGDAHAAGYAPSTDGSARRIVMRLPLPRPRPPLKVGVCRQSLDGMGPAAGLKHLSRLPQVLLSRERAEQGWDEALVADADGQLCEATQGNVLVRLAGRWVTPPVGNGVAGVYRQYLCQELDVREQPVALAELPQAEALAICNAVRGVEAVIEVAALKRFDPALALALRDRARQQ